MGNVIFLDGRLGTRAAKPVPAGHEADILIFQGVRFERLTDDMIAQATTRQRRLPALQNHATAEELE